MDRVIETMDGFDCIVDGETFGTWRSRREAEAGMKVEQDRVAHRRRLDGLTDAEIQRYIEWRANGS